MVPIGTLVSTTASLTLVVFDAASAADWVPTKAAATKAQFTGHPAEIMRGLAKGEEVAAVDVGASGGFAFELEGKSGRIEVYRVAGGLALVAPPRAWLRERTPGADVDALFAEALGAADEATELGELELTSGKLAAVYLWHKKVGAAQGLAAALAPGTAQAFGDGYGDGDGGLVIDVGPGTYRLARHEVTRDDHTLVAMFLTRGT
jgi:hypothetical protein